MCCANRGEAGGDEPRSQERQTIFEAYGAELELTPGRNGNNQPINFNLILTYT